MNEITLLTAITDIDDAFVAESAPTVRKKRTWCKIAAIAACLALIVTGGVSVFRRSMYDPQRTPLILSERSNGVKVEYTRDPHYTSSESCLVWLELEEIFSSETTIFRGTVDYIDNIELNFNGRKSYRAIAGIHVDEVLQGDVSVGEVIRILVPCPINGEITQSATEVVAQMREGMEGIFMPRAYSEDSTWEENGATLYLRDIAPYGFWEGMRWAFLDTDDGVVFAKDVYKDIADAATLDEIQAYIGTQIN